MFQVASPDPCSEIEAEISGVEEVRSPATIEALLSLNEAMEGAVVSVDKARNGDGFSSSIAPKVSAEAAFNVSGGVFEEVPEFAITEMLSALLAFTCQIDAG